MSITANITVGSIVNRARSGPRPDAGTSVELARVATWLTNADIAAFAFHAESDLPARSRAGDVLPSWHWFPMFELTWEQLWQALTLTGFTRMRPAELDAALLLLPSWELPLDDLAAALEATTT